MPTSISSGASAVVSKSLGSLLALTGGPFGGMVAASRRETAPARIIRG
jgi:hypothetical protein